MNVFDDRVVRHWLPAYARGSLLPTPGITTLTIQAGAAQSRIPLIYGRPTGQHAQDAYYHLVKDYQRYIKRLGAIKLERELVSLRRTATRPDGAPSMLSPPTVHKHWSEK